MDQWGVGREGFDDGLVIFFDMQPNLQHGQVQLYAGPGFEAAYLSNRSARRSSRTTCCRTCESADFDGALAVALEKVDAAATPEHAAALQRSRQINAVVGLVGAPIVFLGLSGWALFHWRRFGKDPVYLDDPSVLMPAPPPDLTAASGAMVMDGSTSRRALTTAMLDLASRGLIAFREDNGGILGLGGHKVGIDVGPGRGRRRGRGAAPAQRAPADRPGRGGRAHPARDARCRRGRRVHHARRPAQVRVGGERLRHRPREPRRRSRVVRRAAEQGRRALDRPRRPRHRRRGHRRRRRAQHPVLGPDAPRRCGHRGRHRDHDRRPGDAGRDDGRRDDPGDARRLPADAPEDDGAGALDAAGRRRGRPRGGSRPPTRPSSGGPPSACSARSRTSCRAASRTSRRARRAGRSPTSRSGTRPRAGRRSWAARRRAAAAAASSPIRASPTSAA